MPPKTHPESRHEPTENPIPAEPIDELIQLAASNPLVEVRVEEVDPTTGERAYIDSFRESKFTLDALAARCGAGEYLLIARERNQYRMRCRYTVSEKAAMAAMVSSAPPPPPPASGPESDVVREIMARLEAIEARRAEPGAAGRFDIAEVLKAVFAGLGPAASFITAMRAGRRGADEALESIVKAQAAMLQQQGAAIDLQVKRAEAEATIRGLEPDDDDDAEETDWRDWVRPLAERFVQAHGGRAMEVLAAKLTNEQFAKVTEQVLGLLGNSEGDE